MKKLSNNLSAIQRFNIYCSDPDENGCINWLAKKDKDGYGKIQIEPGNRVLSHRFSYEHFIGKIPKDIWVLHKCDNPSCVNPQHLFLGNAKDNALDRSKKGRGARNNLAGYPMKMLPNSKLSKSDVLEIRKLLESKNTMIHIASIFNVNKMAIFNIKHKITWYHLE